MKKTIRIIGTTAVTAALGLGASALPASAAVSATANSWNQSSFQNRHQMQDNTRHDTQRGWFDGEDRWHSNSDGWGWRDDDGKWRDDNDHNGSWTGHDGCRHDKDGFFDHNGQRHDNNRRHHRTITW